MTNGMGTYSLLSILAPDEIGKTVEVIVIGEGALGPAPSHSFSPCSASMQCIWYGCQNVTRAWGNVLAMRSVVFGGI